MIRTGIWRIVASWASRSRVGLSPTRPLTAAGIRIEPPPSFAWAIGTTPAATIAAEPAELAPAVWSVFQGLRTGPSRGCSALGEKPYSLSWLLPSGTSPVARYIRAKSPSRFAGTGVPGVGALHGRHPGDLDVVLDPGRYAGEEPRPRVPRLGPGPVERLVGDAVELGLAPARRARSPPRRPRGSRPRPACSASTSPTASCSPRASSSEGVDARGHERKLVLAGRHRVESRRSACRDHPRDREPPSSRRPRTSRPG